MVALFLPLADFREFQKFYYLAGIVEREMWLEFYPEILTCSERWIQLDRIQTNTEKDSFTEKIIHRKSAEE